MRASPALLLVQFSLWSAFICYLAFCRLTSAATIGMFCVNICLTESNLSREESATDCLGNRLWQQRHYSSINVFSFSVLSVYHIWRPRRYAKWDRLRRTRMAMASQLERTKCWRDVLPNAAIWGLRVGLHKTQWQMFLKWTLWFPVTASYENLNTGKFQ